MSRGIILNSWCQNENKQGRPKWLKRENCASTQAFHVSQSRKAEMKLTDECAELAETIETVQTKL
jgi:hypothetical protein